MRITLILVYLFTAHNLFSQQNNFTSFPQYKTKVDSLVESIDRNIGLLSVNKMTGKIMQHEFNAKVYYENHTSSIYKVVYTLPQAPLTESERIFHYYKGNLVKLGIGAQVYYLFEKKVMTGDGSVVNNSIMQEIIQFEEESRKTILVLM